MRVPFIAGNWKMYMTGAQTEELLLSLKTRLAGVKDAEIGVCPPFPYLKLASGLLKGSNIGLGAQNMGWETQGAFTGEVSPVMLVDCGCKYVILGHSERRQYIKETDDLINKKLQLALKSGLSPIVCIGETLEERERDETEKVVEKQIEGCLKELTSAQMADVTLAYEPVWAIGTGKTATPEQAQSVHRLIRDWLSKRFEPSAARKVRIQYGGSVKPENARELLSQPDIDGALVGGASLKADQFESIVKSL